MIIKWISLYLLVGIMFLTFMFVYSFLRGKANYSRVLGLLSLSLQVYLLGYLLELNVDSLSDMLFWNQVQYLGIPFFPVLWLIVSMLYTGNGYLLRGWKSVALFTIPILTFIARLTNASHHLYYEKIELQTIGDLNLMFLTKGPWYLLQMAYVLFTLVMCTRFYFKRYQNSVGDEKIQFRLLLTASVLPYISLVLGTLNVGGIGIDYTALILPPCILLINIALTRYNFLDIKSLAWQRIFEDSHSGLILLNKVYQVLDFNKASLGFLQWFDIILKEDQMTYLLRNQPDLLQAIKDCEDRVFAIENLGQQKYLSLQVNHVLNKNTVVGYLVTLEDVTERESLKVKLLEMANTDELSGLNNRRNFNLSAKAHFERAQRYGEALAVLMMDIDHFKKINDAFGHYIGDQVIKLFSRKLQDLFRESDVIGRMGGEEFAVVMLNTSEATAFEKAEHFRESICKEPFSIEGHLVHVTVSIGLVQFSGTSLNMEQMINQADQALYEAKSAGRNQTRVSAH